MKLCLFIRMRHFMQFCDTQCTFYDVRTFAYMYTKNRMCVCVCIRSLCIDDFSVEQDIEVYICKEKPWQSIISTNTKCNVFTIYHLPCFVSLLQIDAHRWNMQHTKPQLYTFQSQVNHHSSTLKLSMSSPNHSQCMNSEQHSLTVYAASTFTQMEC